jgi:hypothetical protein
VQGRQQFAVAGVDRRDATEVPVVLGDLLQSFVGDVTLRRKGITSSGPSGPPKDSSRNAS